MKYIGPLYGKVCGKYILLNQEATEHSEVLEVPASISNPVVVDGERLVQFISPSTCVMDEEWIDTRCECYVDCVECIRAYLTGEGEEDATTTD